jgi:hypothetical protein
MKYITILILFCCLSANAQTSPKKTSAPIEKPIAAKYDALALAKTTLDFYIKNADTIRTGDRKRKRNTYIYFYTKENVDIKGQKIKNCLIWNKNKEVFTNAAVFPLEINKNDTIKYRFIEVIVKKDTTNVKINLKTPQILLYFNTLTYFRGSKTDKMELVDAPPDCDPETVKTSRTKRITQTPIQCLNLDAIFLYNKKTKKWLHRTDFERNVERRTWFLKRFLF